MFFSLLLLRIVLVLFYVVNAMLPQHYQVGRRNPEHDDGDDDDDDLLAARRRRQARASASLAGALRQPAPPLGLTGVLCDTQCLTIPGRGSLQYTVFRPRYLHRMPPLVCLAGGPFLPWTYLNVLVHLIHDRSLVFLYFIGGGQSKALQNSSHHGRVRTKEDDTLTNPIPGMVQDLQELLRHLRLKHYHLYAHSFGGLVAYEALRTTTGFTTTTREATCLSLILSSTPANLPQTLQHIEELKAGCRASADEAADDDAEDDGARLFAATHECRVRPLPLALQQSFAMAGFFSSPAGWQSVQDYVAPGGTDDDQQPPSNKLPVLLLRGEFDFISETCMEPWMAHLGGSPNACTIRTLPGVAHYGMLEDEHTYGAVLRKFLASVPEPPLQLPQPPPPAARGGASTTTRRSRLPR